MKLALAVLAIAACPNPSGDDDEVCVLDQVDISCAGSIAIGEELYDRSTSRTNACAEHADIMNQVTCTNGGCAVQVPMTSPMGADAAAIGDPAILCAATPEAKVGDPCTHQCLPTRAQLAADGTVTGQTYLACDLTSHCVAVAPPVLADYLAPCDPVLLATYGTANATGVVATSTQICLIAWDAAAKAPKSGVTHSCVGDWDCPAGALCDDHIASLAGGALTICKPGPRGTLTPSMLK